MLVSSHVLDHRLDLYETNKDIAFQNQKIYQIFVYRRLYTNIW